jgi:hypothetical protein
MISFLWNKKMGCRNQPNLRSERREKKELDYTIKILLFLVMGKKICGSCNFLFKSYAKRDILGEW